MVEAVASNGSQVAVVADGSPASMASDDAELDGVAEVWGTALCLPAARAGAALALPGPVDARWRSGAEANVAQAAAWWGGRPDLELVPVEGRPPSTEPGDEAPGRALCFTGGVDSFFSLLVGDHRPTHLLFVAGYDVEVADDRRMAQVRAALDEVAGAVGTETMVVRSDLRAHPGFTSVSWEHTHGAALAAVGHALHRTIGTVVIPPSYAESRLVPWGSRPDLDPRWSVPGRLKVEHGDASGRRLDRVLAIAEHPLVHRHLRVCWQNVDGALNCGQCEKCVRTMVMLAGADQLQHCATFPDRTELPGLVSGLAALEPEHVEMWSDLPGLVLRPDERVAIEELLARS